MDKIKVIFTGGTIGSLQSNNEINTNTKTQYLLLQNYGKNLERFSTCSALNILSENATFDDVLEMKKAIENAQNEQDIKGIILTHGTDSLAYTSAYLSFLLQNLHIPVVIIASNYTLDNKKANGNINFSVAVDLIDDNKLQPNVYVVFKNAKDDFVSVHLGSRLNAPAPYDDDFYSPHTFRFATYKNNKFYYENTNVKALSNNFNFAKKQNCKPMFIVPYTGLNYKNLLDVKPTFVLHEFYHSGTANTSKSEDNSFIEFAKECDANNTPLYCCNVVNSSVCYASTNSLKKSNIQMLYNILSSVALAKLIVAYNLLDKKDILAFLQTDIAGEFLLEG